jgi:tripartite-type tricarboxylate transporter receptor subunit TctC
MKPAWLAAALALGLLACGRPDDGGAGGGGQAFFRGKTMTYIVATDPGGGYDTYGRLVSKYLARHLGLANVVVRNVPGGGHIKGANVVFTARPDGLTLGTFNTGLIVAQLLRRDGLSGDLTSLSWIGKAGREPRVFTVSARSGFRSIDDLRGAARPILMGTNGVGNESYYDALLLAHALELRIKLVFGLASREAQLSMLRGEIDGEVGAASSYRTFVENGYGVTVLRVGQGAGVDERIPDAAKLATTAEGRRIVEFLEALTELMRWTAGPPGIPDDRLAVLREAYTSALSDPELLSEARALGIPIVPMDGTTLASEVKRAMTLAPETVALITSIVQPRQGQ